VLTDSTPFSFSNRVTGHIATKTKGTSYIDDLDLLTFASFSYFDGGGFKDIVSVTDGVPSDVSWAQLEWLASHAKNASFDSSHKVVVFTKGGTFDVDDAENGGDPDDKGKTLMIFNTKDPITLTRTADNRAFGPSVLAPFSKVKLEGVAKSIDGFIVAKEFETSGATQDNLLLKGNGYNGQLLCS
jgi:hypothetical protein